ncbi:MAG: TolC family protein [Candidatus Cloacimonadales bacterium]
MKKLNILVILFSLTFLSAKVLTLDEAVNLALENSHESQQLIIEQNKVESNYNTTLWNIAPDGSIQYNVSNGSRSKTSESLGFSVSKNILSTLPDYFNWKTAKNNIEMNNLSNKQTTKSIAWNVLNSYINLLLNQKRLEVYQQNYVVQLDLLEKTKLLKQQGRKTPYEANQAEINTLNSELNLLDAQKSINQKERDLLLLLNIEADSLFLQDIELEIAPEYSFNIENEKSFSILLREMSIEHNKLLLQQDRLRFLPSLNLSWSYGRGSTNNEPFEFSNYTGSSTWGLSLSYPILNQFKQHESHFRTKQNLFSEEINLDKQVKEFKANYEQLVADLENQMLKKGINDKILEQSQENFEIAKVNYNLGIIKTIELDQSQTELREAELNNLDIGYQIYLKQQAINHLLSKKIAGKW